MGGARWTWRLLALPGVAWLSVFFLVALYAVLAVAFGNQDTLSQPVPFWNPLDWNVGYVLEVLKNIWHGDQFLTVSLRTIEFVVIAVLLSLLVGYPVAYFTARHAGRWKGLVLVGLILPLWINYLMRMLAWINLLAADGIGSRTLHGLGIEKLFLTIRPARRARRLAQRAADDGHPRARLRLPAVLHPAAVRRHRPDRRAPDRGRARPRGEPAERVPARHASALRPGDPRRRGADRAADVRRLLHRRPRLGLDPDEHDRQPDRRVHAPGIGEGHRRGAHAAALGVPPRADVLLPAHTRRAGTSAQTT
jgi:hypothetical protein